MKKLLKTKKKQIVTYNGTKAYKSDCRLIQDEYYKIGIVNQKDSGQCYKIGTRYVRINSGLIKWNHTTKEYVRIKNNKNLMYGIVNSKLEEGYFNIDIYENIKVCKNHRYCSSLNISEIPYENGMNKECLGDKYVQSLMNGVYFEKKKIDSYYYNILSFIQLEHQGKARYSKTEIPNEMYNIDSSPLFTIYSNHYKNYLANIGDKYKYISDQIPYSIGLEFETQSGHLPINICKKYGVVPLKDGSIRGHEYTTVPYRDKKIDSVYELCKELNKRTTIDFNCSLHVHFGNVRIDKLYTIALYMLCYQLQHEIHEIIPGYKKSFDYLKNKKNPKDHCKYLNSLGLFRNNIYVNDEVNENNLDKSFDNIYMFLNEGNKVSKEYSLENRKHALGNDANKWNYKARYYVVNFFNMFFKDSKTVEFRVHHATSNQYKTIYWILICNAILRYAEDNTQNIITKQEKLDLNIIVESVYDSKLSDVLKDYIIERKDKFFNCYIGQDYLGDEFYTDYKYVHKKGAKELLL